MRFPQDWRFPMPCPACAAVKGTPQRVATDDRLLMVDLSCGECGHEWTISAPAPAMFVTSDPSASVLRPKGDRRNAATKVGG